MSTLHRLTTATAAAMREFRRTYNDPGAVMTETAADERRIAYNLLWSYYQNSAFEDLTLWSAYARRYRLYRQTRPIYNPAARIVDFYAGAIYAGKWTSKPEKMTAPDSAIPFADDTPPELLSAIAQLFRISNWQQTNRLMVRHGAALGDAMLIAVDDPQRRRVYLDLIWPGHISELELDAVGNVQAYALEYVSAHADGQKFTYRRTVDKESIRTFADDTPTGFGDSPAAYPNPYGFVPAAWIRHTLSGSEHGRPAIRSIPKMDELNSLAAHALDQAHRILGAPILVTGITTTPTRDPRSTTATQADPNVGRQEIPFISSTDPGASVQTLKMDAGETIEHIDHLLAEIEKDHPELQYFDALRQMTTVTGPGADRMFGDVRYRVQEARASYDQQLIKALQMGIAIAGWRAQRGDWGSASTLTAQQSAYLPFNLESYAAGNLDMQIEDRPLTPPTVAEQMEEERARLQLDGDRRQAEPANQSAGIRSRIAAAVAATSQTAPAGPAPEPAADDNE